jgi:ankyrin repeat protein
MPSEEDDKQYALAVTLGKQAVLVKIEAKGYKPSFKVLAEGLQGACQTVCADGVELALGYYRALEGGKKEFIQLYSQPQWSQSGGRWEFGGISAWMALFESGKGPGDANFVACAQSLSQTGFGFGALMDANAARDEGWTMMDQCATRGWLEFAKKLSKDNGWSAQSNYGKATPLDIALRSGRGDFAAWLVANNTKGGPLSVVEAARGLSEPFRPQKGSYEPASWDQQILSLRIGAKLSGLAEIASETWPNTMAEPLKNPGRLMNWLMVSSARAQAAQDEAASPKAMERRSKELAKKQGQDWEALSKTAQGGGLFSAFGKKARAAAAELKEQIARQAEADLKAVQAAQPPIREALAEVDAGNLSAAAKIFGGFPAEARLPACVAMLGLAKVGYWDMPMPQEDGASLQDRHPLRWAGFKLALMACGRGVDGPIPGLSGTTLAGLCAALGFEDALSELIDAGASLDPDHMSQGPSPLELSLRNGRVRFAQVLIGAGASPMEGIGETAFGYPSKKWAVHMAFDKRELGLVKSMLASDPRCAMLPDPQGKTILQRAIELEGQGGADKDFGAQIASLAERSLIDQAAVAAPATRPRSL